MIRALMFLVILGIILLGIGWVVGGIVGISIALILSLLINFFSYWKSDQIVLKVFGAEPLKDRKIRKIVEHLCQEAKMPIPKLYLIKKKVPNAFATGRDPKHSAIAITSGILELDDEEIQGVLAHELAHIKNRDILITTISAILAVAISYIAEIGYWSLFFSGDERGEGSLIGLILIIIFAPIAALIVRSAISQSREYKADYTGVLITKKPHALANALKKISQISRNFPMKGPASTANLWIVNPFHRDWFVRLFSTHPPIEKRIKRLEEMEGYGINV